jgi:hypothetical protein
MGIGVQIPASAFSVTFINLFFNKNSMKLLIYLLLTLLLVTTVQSISTLKELKIGESFVTENQNITLLDLDRGDEKVILCINGVKGIVSETRNRKVNNVLVEVRSVKRDKANIKFESNCNNCQLNNNNACFNQCTSSLDCDDNNEDTLDLCTGSPLVCTHTDTTLEPETPPITEDNSDEITVIVNIEEPQIEPPKKENFISRVIFWIKSIF